MITERAMLQCSFERTIARAAEHFIVGEDLLYDSPRVADQKRASAAADSLKLAPRHRCPASLPPDLGERLRVTREELVGCLPVRVCHISKSNLHSASD